MSILSTIAAPSISGNRNPRRLIPVPAGFNFSPPFKVYYHPSKGFYPSPNWSIESHHGIEIVKTYRVNTVTGNDANDGSLGSPLASISEAESRGDADMIILESGSYFHKGNCPLGLSRPTYILGEGTGSDVPKITSDVNYQLGTFSNVDSHWEASSVEFVAAVWDWSDIDENGNPQKLTKVNSIVEVDATPNSFYCINTVAVYIHTSDSREPDADIICYGSLSHQTKKDNYTIVFENIQFIGGGVRLWNNSATGGTKVYLKDIHSYTNFTIQGIDLIICENVTGNPGEDFLNYDSRNGVISQGVEINVDGSNYGVGSTSGQSSTTHNGCRIIRINGVYNDTSGQNIADVNGGQTWMLGCLLQNSETEVGYLTQGVETWMELVQILGNDTAIDIQTGTTVYHKNITYEGAIVGGGSFVAYT